MPDADAGPDAAAGTQIGLLAPGGSTRWFPAGAQGASRLAVSLRYPVTSVAVLVRAGGKSSQLGPPSVAEPDGSVLVADGQLQDALVPPRWGYAGRDGSFAVFADHLARGPLSLAALPGRSVSGASVRRAAGSAADPTAAAWPLDAVSASFARWRRRPAGAPPGSPGAARRPPWPFAGSAWSRPSTSRREPGW